MDAKQETNSIAINEKSLSLATSPVQDTIVTYKPQRTKKAEASLSLFSVLWNSLPIKIKWLQSLGILAAIGAGGLRPCTALIFGRLINNFNQSRTISPDVLQTIINNNVVFYVYLFLVQFVLIYTYALLLATTSGHIVSLLRTAYMRSLLSQKVTFFETYTPGLVATVLSTNADNVQTGLSERMGVAFQSASEVVCAFIIAFTQSWKLTLVASTTIVVLSGGSAITVRQDAKLRTKINKAASQAMSVAEEALSSIQSIVALGAQDKMLGRFAVHLDTAKKLGLKRSPVVGIQYSFDYFILLCAYALSYWYGVRLLLQGEITNGGSVFIVILSVNTATDALQKLLPSLNVVTEAKGAAEDLLRIIAQSNSDASSADLTTLSTLVGEIILKDITFSYPSRPHVVVLDHLTMVFRAGCSTAIVGPSGSGKSTLVGLIEGWYDITEGTLLLDSEHVEKFDSKWLRSQIGVVQQDPFLFNDTIYQNVVNGISEAYTSKMDEPEKRNLVQNACIQSGIHEFISSLPLGYNTMVGEAGRGLSGGQRQRVAIARAIVSNPKILILDEATSALDPEAEKAIQATLDQIAQGRTTLVIAHKLSTIQKADHIYVMNHGRIVEQGTHQSLLEANGPYSYLVKAQRLEPVTDHQAQEEKQPTFEASDTLSQDIMDDKQEMANVDTPNPKATKSASTPPFLACSAIMFRGQPKLQLYLLIGLIACVAAGAVYPSQAILFAKLVTTFQLTGDPLSSATRFWSLMFFLLALGVLAAFAILGTMFTILNSHNLRFYRAEYFQAMLRQDISYFNDPLNTSGALSSRLSSHTDQFQAFVSVTIGFLLVIVVDLVSSIVLSLVVQWKLSLVALFGSLPLIISAGYIGVRLQAQSLFSTAAVAEESTRFASEAVGAIKTVASLALADRALSKYEELISHTMKGYYRRSAWIMMFFAFAGSARYLGMALTFWYGGKLLVQQEVSAYAYFVIFIAVVAGGEAAGELFAETKNIVKAQAAAKHILTLYSRVPESIAQGGHEVPKPQDSFNAIEFCNVSFRYKTRSHSPILNRLSLQVSPGQNVAIVGPSGSGKSTVIALLERFYDPNFGSILINGTDLSTLDVERYRATLSLVSQETFLYQGSIRENIELGLKDTMISEKQLVQACQDANIHDFITSLPDGYNTECGNKGLSLSGGQRQRIAIARALIRKPSILLLDEATSALDSESERLVQAALEKTMKGRTTITVAHRLSTIKAADRIFVMSLGSIVEQGTHVDLLKKRGFYWQMCQAQSLSYDAEWTA